MHELNRIVWICQWYPHEGKPYTGDFIQRHAQAVSQFIPITTFACFEHPSKEGIEINKNGNLTETIIYYKAISTGIDKIDKALRWSRWFAILKKQLLKYEKEYGRPQLLHGHILLNTGWLCLWAKRKWGTPFVTSEHWSGFMPGAVKGYDDYNKWSKKKLGEIIRKSKSVTCVSNALIERLKLIEPNGNFMRIPNVVNEKIFNYQPIKKTINNPVFIHISTGSPQKNIADTLAGFAIFCEKFPTAQLIMVCPKNEKNYSVSKKIENNVIWKDDMPQAELAELIRHSDGCILYSNYETFGCVIIEANALGVPLIVSNIPVLQELVTENENGVIAATADPYALSTALKKFVSFPFDHKTISIRTLDQFSYGVIGQQFIDIYKKILE